MTKHRPLTFTNFDQAKQSMGIKGAYEEWASEEEAEAFLTELTVQLQDRWVHAPLDEAVLKNDIAHIVQGMVDAGKVFFQHGRWSMSPRMSVDEAKQSQTLLETLYDEV